MRISDWSSDVCSSDLEEVYPDQVATAFPRRIRADCQGRRDGFGAGHLYVRLQPVPMEERPPTDLSARPGCAVDAADAKLNIRNGEQDDGQIGRASRRGRVGEYV